jgi:hypothetical protein
MSPFWMTVAEWYHPERALILTKINVVAWSAADLVIVAALLAIVDLCARAEGRGRARLRWFLLALTALATPAVCLAESQSAVLGLEGAICGCQFAILAGTGVKDLRLLVRTYERRMRAA